MNCTVNDIFHFQSEINKDELNETRVNEEDKKVRETLALGVTTFRENINIRRAQCIKSSDDGTSYLVTFTHPPPPKDEGGSGSVILGKYAAILALKSNPPNIQLGEQLCQHVIGRGSAITREITLNISYSLCHTSLGSCGVILCNNN